MWQGQNAGSERTENYERTDDVTPPHSFAHYVRS